MHCITHNTPEPGRPFTAGVAEPDGQEVLADACAVHRVEGTICHAGELLHYELFPAVLRRNSTTEVRASQSAADLQELLVAE